MSRLNTRIPLSDVESRTVDPLASGITEFDWKTVFERLDKERLSADEWRKLADALTIILQWVAGSRGRKLTREHVGQRAIALLWSINPEYFGGKSIRQIAKLVKSSPRLMHRFTSRSAKIFQIRNRASMSHAANFKSPTLTALNAEDKALLRLFCNTVEMRAEATMLKTHKVEGAHYKAMRRLREEFGI